MGGQLIIERGWVMFTEWKHMISDPRMESKVEHDVKV